MPVLVHKRGVAVVDAYSGGRHLIAAYQAIGFPVVHIQSGDPGVFAKDNDIAMQSASRHIVASDYSERALLEILREENVQLVVAGTESAVLLTDRLAEELNLPFRNGTCLSTARRDKFEMQERIREVGLAAIDQAKVTTGSEIRQWLQIHGKYPVVVKPLRSAGTDGVSICHDAEASEAALKAILSNTNMFGETNDSALVQEFLDGAEYVVNGVACGGALAITEGWRSDKLEHMGSRVYDTQYLFCAGDQYFDEVTFYVKRVCAALGIVNGPFHAEVMMTAHGPVLIEIGARVAGGADPYFVEICLGPSQISTLVQASLQPAAFAQILNHHTARLPVLRAAYVFLIARAGGQVSEPDLGTFFEISGVATAAYHYNSGDYQRPTRDLLSAAGVVTVVAADELSLRSAVEQVRKREELFYRNTVALDA